MAQNPSIESGIYSRAAKKPSILRWQIIITLCCAIFYIATAQRGPAWQDSGIHQLRALQAQFDNPLGLALAHPLLIALAQPLKWIFGPMTLATAMNMLSAVAMAVTVGNVFRLSKLTGASLKASAIAAVMLGVGHTSWWLATITESYTLVCMLLSFELIALHKLINKPSISKVLLLAAISGLGWSLHNFALLPIPVYLVVISSLIYKKRLKIICIPLAAIAWALAGGLQLWLVISHLSNGENLSAVISSALFGNSWQNNVLGANAASLVKAALYILLNFPFLSLLALLSGLVLSVKSAVSTNQADSTRVFMRSFTAITLIELLFAVRYNVPDQFMFLLPAYVPLAVMAAVGADWLISRRNKNLSKALGAALVISLVLTPPLYIAAAWQLNAIGKSIRANREIPYRTENNYWIIPAKCGDHSASILAAQSLLDSPDNCVLTADNTIAPPVRYLQLAQDIKTDAEIIWAGTQGVPVSQLTINNWHKILNGRDLYVIMSSPAPLKADVMALSEDCGSDVLRKIPNSAISDALHK